MSGRAILARPPLRPVTPAVRLPFRRYADVAYLAVPFVPRHLAASDPSMLELSVNVYCRALAAGAIGHSAWSVRVASKALLSFQRTRHSVEIREDCSFIRVYTRLRFLPAALDLGGALARSQAEVVHGSTCP